MGAPANAAAGAALIRNGNDNDFFMLAGNSSTGFYRY
jgi:hypothetical protein